LRKELDNRMVSYFNNLHRAYVYVGNFWNEKPAHIHKDIKDARLAHVPLDALIGEPDSTIMFNFRERAKGEHSDALMTG